ncbi:unnamed protein product [Linum tenue]|uniref:Uncharacterized protein n=1 Tax=Linum tenue TaxID=586396 RepID=A0AAV0I002_9ROSI|nr:unnamed protein product [Linum tenue]
MSSLASRFSSLLRVCRTSSLVSSSGDCAQKSLRAWCSTLSFDDVNDNNEAKAEEVEADFDDFIGEKLPDMQLQGVDPGKGWAFRGVHKAIICGKVGQTPLQKILRNGQTVTIFTVGTGGMFDQRLLGAKDLPKPVQWHRIAVHNNVLEAYAVQQLAKNSSVFVEGDIETRIYNDSISGEIKNIPEICVRRDGRIRLIKGGENKRNFDLSFADLREGLFS